MDPEYARIAVLALVVAPAMPLGVWIVRTRRPN